MKLVEDDDELVICRVDLFPARVDVTYPDSTTGRIALARAIVTQDRAYFYVDSATGPRTTLYGRLDAFSGRNTTGYIATLADGTVVRFKRSGGCGCGSRLRGFRPFPRMMQGPLV